MRERARPRGLALPIAISALLHAGIATGLLLARPKSAPARPPVYKVNIVAAPPGPRQIGAVTPTPPAQTPPEEVKTPARADVTPPAPVLPPKKQPSAATRTPPAPATPVPIPPKTQRQNAPLPQAGGGPTGGRGTDVATVRTEGIEFPYPGYLNNIVRQIALRFDPSTRNGGLRAEVSFLIHRDGSISNLRFLTRSGVYGFDLEAQGAVEAAANAHAFGPLPTGFTDDILPVIFSFDPSLLR